MDARLRAASRMIAGPRHCDIGSDHGYLLHDLLSRGVISHGIAVENKAAPHANSVRTLSGMAAEVRLGDGLEPIREGEIDSLSICGMGAESIVKILGAYPDRVPGKVVLQANRQSELLRRWAIEAGFWLVDEVEICGRWWYEILQFEYHPCEADPAYRNSTEASKQAIALALGPHFIGRKDATTQERFRAEAEKLRQHETLNGASTRRLMYLDEVLGGWQGDK